MNSKVTPVEVVVRDPKRTPKDASIRGGAGLLALAVKAALVVWLFPPVSHIFGQNWTPNFGAALLLVTLWSMVFKTYRLATLSEGDTNGYRFLK